MDKNIKTILGMRVDSKYKSNLQVHRLQTPYRRRGKNTIKTQSYRISGSQQMEFFFTFGW